MRKITLFLMSLFLTVGAMAQNFVAPEVGKFYKIKGDSQSHPWVTANTNSSGSVSVSANEADAAVFERTANGLKAVSTGKYLGYSGGKYTYSDTELTVELVNTGAQANNEGKYAIKSGNNWMFNNNTDGIVHEADAWLDLPRLWGFIEVEAESLGNSVAKAELETAIANAQALLGQITIGEGIGEYTGEYTAAEIESVFGSVENFYNSIDENTPVETIEAYTEMVNEAIASYSLNMPKAGKYYRLKGASGNYIDASAIYNNADATAGQMSMKSADDCNFNGTVFYLDENSKLLNYHTQTYITATREIAASVEAGGNTWTFSASSIVGKYKIKSNDGNWLHDNSGNRADRCNQDPADHAGTHSWILEEVVIESEEPENPEPENPEPENPDSENTTAVEKVEIKNEKSEIYDLTGRKVENIAKAGVYIVNGCKVLVK